MVEAVEWYREEPLEYLNTPAQLESLVLVVQT